HPGPRPREGSSGGAVMTCEQIRSRLSWLLDGELDAAEADAVRAHAATCDKCGPLLAELKATDAEIRAALLAVRPRSDFPQRVVAAAMKKPLSPKRLLVGLAAGFFILL